MMNDKYCKKTHHLSRTKLKREKKKISNYINSHMLCFLFFFFFYLSYIYIKYTK